MNKEFTAYALLGKPGSGKESVRELITKILTEEYSKKVFYSNNGDRFREMIRRQENSLIKLSDHSHKRIKEITDGGKLHCSAISTAVWTTFFLQEHNGEEVIVIEGFPRRLEDGPALSQFFEEFCHAKVVYVYVTVDDEVIIERMKARHAENPREDTSTDEKIKIRLKEFYDKNYPVIEYLRNKFPEDFVTIDNNGEREELERQVRILCSK